MCVVVLREESQTRLLAVQSENMDAPVVENQDSNHC